MADNHQRDMKVHYTECFDLKREFPMSVRRGFKKSGLLFLFTFGFLMASLLINEYWVSSIEDDFERTLAQLAMSVVVLLLFFAAVARFLYYEIERMFCDYRVRGGSLHICKGILIKEKGSFPLSRITDIYLHRGVGDLVFGLSSLHVSTPTNASGEFAYIHGLRIKNAERLRNKLESLVKEHDHNITNISHLMGDLMTPLGQRRALKNQNA